METEDAAAARKDGEANAAPAAADGEAGKQNEPEPSSYRMDNPARVVPTQARWVAWDTAGRYVPIKPYCTTGIVIVKDTTPGECALNLKCPYLVSSVQLAYAWQRVARVSLAQESAAHRQCIC